MKRRLRRWRLRWRDRFDENVGHAERELQRHRTDTLILSRLLDRLAIESEAMKHRARERGQRP